MKINIKRYPLLWMAKVVKPKDAWHSKIMLFILHGVLTIAYGIH